MTPTATRPRGLRLRDRRQLVGDVLVAAVALATFTAAAALDRPAPIVDLVTIVNPTVFQVEVDGRGAGHDGAWLSLGGIRRESGRTVEQVLDQGEQWTFRFSYGRVVAGEVMLGRAELRRPVTVPTEAGERLRDAGYPPSAY